MFNHKKYIHTYIHTHTYGENLTVDHILYDYQTTEGERKIYTQPIKSRLVASEKKGSSEKTHQAFHTVRKLKRF
jgi:hypothetical protein